MDPSRLAPGHLRHLRAPRPASLQTPPPRRQPWPVAGTALGRPASPSADEAKNAGEDGRAASSRPVGLTFMLDPGAVYRVRCHMDVAGDPTPIGAAGTAAPGTGPGHQTAGSGNGSTGSAHGSTAATMAGRMARTPAATMAGQMARTPAAAMAGQMAGTLGATMAGRMAGALAATMAGSTAATCPAMKAGGPPGAPSAAPPAASPGKAPVADARTEVGSAEAAAPADLVALCRLPVMQRLLTLAQSRQTLLAFEAQLASDYRRSHPYADEPELARAVYGDPRYEQMINRLKFADSPQCARLLAARIARDNSGLSVWTATAEGFGSEFVLVAAQLPEGVTDWHDLPEDAVLMDPWAQRQGAARSLLIAAGLASSELRVERCFT